MPSVVLRDPEIMSGTPCFRGTRVPVKTLFDSLAHGRPLDEFLDDFPTVYRDQALAALEEAVEKLLATHAHQQNLRSETLALIVLHARSNDAEVLMGFVPRVREALAAIQPGQVITPE
jgi:uncharacterized protein (DUF433 family)